MDDQKNDGQSHHGLVEVYRAANVYDATAMQEILASHGIDAFVGGDMLPQGAGELPMGWSTSPQVCVSKRDAPNAKKILEEADALRVSAQRQRNTKSTEADACLSCGAEMITDTCETCGWTFRDDLGDEVDQDDTTGTPERRTPFFRLGIAIVALLIGAGIGLHRLTVILQYPNSAIAEVAGAGKGDLRQYYMYRFDVEGKTYEIPDVHEMGNWPTTIVRFGDDPQQGIFDEGYPLVFAAVWLFLGGGFLVWAIVSPDALWRRRPNEVPAKS